MPRFWTNEHGADGLRDKFSVYKSKERLTADGMPHGTLLDCYPHDRRIGADGEFVFVLRPETDAQAWLALREYAHEVEHRAPQLAREIRTQLRRIRQEN